MSHYRDPRGPEMVERTTYDMPVLTLSFTGYDIDHRPSLHGPTLGEILKSDEFYARLDDLLASMWINPERVTVDMTTEEEPL